MKVDLRPNPFSKLKRKSEIKDDSEVEEEPQQQEPEKEVSFPQDSAYNHIKCKAIRSKKYEEKRKEKVQAKRDAKKLRLEQGLPKQTPHTIESLREKDETVVEGSLDDEANQEVKLELDNDEFAAYYR